MSNITISLAISHTPWVPARVESFGRLENRLAQSVGACPTWDFARAAGMTEKKSFTERAPNWSWSEDMWRWASETSATHCLFLQDDVIPAPNFWPAIHAMVEAHPDQIIGLESVHPGGMSLARAGQHGYTTADGLIGVGYVEPRSVVVEKLKWRLFDLKRGAVENMTEDALINVFALCTGRRIWHPCPTIIQHDTSLESTYGNDAHSHREPCVTWRDGDVCDFAVADLEEPSFWGKSSGPHLGRFYEMTIELARRWAKSWTSEKHLASQRDVGPAMLTKWVNR